MIQLATVLDLDAIGEIEVHSFPRPWSRESFAAELTREQARIIVAREPRGLAGFMNYWLVADEVHVLSIATHPDHRRRGVGAALLAYALAEGEARGCQLATLEVRRSNEPAIALYTRAGFSVTHVRARYYADNNEDAFVMLKSLAATAPRP